MFLKNFFYYSRKERRGIFLLLLLLAVAISIQSILSYTDSRQQDQTLADSAWLASYASFCTSLHEQAPEYRDHQPPSSPRARQKPDYFTFDPNRADSAEFARMGLSSFVIRNIMRYREKGGKFKDTDALSRIYGLSSKEFAALRPYIQIQTELQQSPQKNLPPQKDSLYPTLKYPAGTVIDLNAADTNSLKMIPGIGSFTAQRILNFRNRLGGFHSLLQLREIRQFPDSLLKWFRIETPPRRTLQINHWSIERLASHPYLNFYQARVIVEYRRKHGPLQSLKPLSLYEEFMPSELERLEPYVQF